MTVLACFLHPPTPLQQNPKHNVILTSPNTVKVVKCDPEQHFKEKFLFDHLIKAPQVRYCALFTN